MTIIFISKAASSRFLIQHFTCANVTFISYWRRKQNPLNDVRSYCDTKKKGGDVAEAGSVWVAVFSPSAWLEGLMLSAYNTEVVWNRTTSFHCWKRVDPFMMSGRLMHQPLKRRPPPASYNRLIKHFQTAVHMTSNKDNKHNKQIIA